MTLGREMEFNVTYDIQVRITVPTQAYFSELRVGLRN